MASAQIGAASEESVYCIFILGLYNKSRANIEYWVRIERLSSGQSNLYYQQLANLSPNWKVEPVVNNHSNGIILQGGEQHSS